MPKVIQKKPGDPTASDIILGPTTRTRVAHIRHVPDFVAAGTRGDEYAMEQYLEYAKFLTKDKG